MGIIYLGVDYCGPPSLYGSVIKRYSAQCIHINVSSFNPTVLERVEYLKYHRQDSKSPPKCKCISKQHASVKAIGDGSFASI